MENEKNIGRDILNDLKEGFSELGSRVNRALEDLTVNEVVEGEVNVRSDVYETVTAYVIELELPGVQKEMVKISARENYLTVKGQKTPQQDADTVDYRYHKRERRYGSFMRSFQLPDYIEMENIKARFNHGLLSIHFPKSGEAEAPVQIDIEE
ncbi:MAG: Hsp20/alpha crystallin family protein [Bacteroidota bacterium]